MWDSLGMLPENLSRHQVARLFEMKVTQKMPFGRGLVSDETEQVLLTARALLRTHQRLPTEASLRRELCAWLAPLPPGIGSSTLKSILKLAFASDSRIGSGNRLGVSSAGNGPLLRAATIGLLLDVGDMARLVSQTTLMTHATPDALACSITTALVFNAAQRSVARGRPLSRDIYRDAAALAHSHLGAESDIGWRDELREAPWSLNRDLMSSTGGGREGSARRGSGTDRMWRRRVRLHTRHDARGRHPDDVNAAADAAIRAGGDTDSVAALACGLVAVASNHDQNFSRLKLWRDPYGLTTRNDPPSDRELLASVARSRHMPGTIAEHLALVTLFALPFLGRRTWIRLISRKAR